MIVYGTDLCKDCVQCKLDLDRAGVRYGYRDISGNLLYLKEFLALRDHDPLFAQVKADGFIGIPVIVTDEGKTTLDWSVFM